MNEEHICRICQLFDAIESSEDPQAATEVFMKETFEGMMDKLFEDDVFNFLDEKYRKEVIEEMSDEEYQQLLDKVENTHKGSHLKLVVDKEQTKH